MKNFIKPIIIIISLIIFSLAIYFWMRSNDEKKIKNEVATRIKEISIIVDKFIKFKRSDADARFVLLAGGDPKLSKETDLGIKQIDESVIKIKNIAGHTKIFLMIEYATLCQEFIISLNNTIQEDLKINNFQLREDDYKRRKMDKESHINSLKKEKAMLLNEKELLLKRSEKAKLLIEKYQKLKTIISEEFLINNDTLDFLKKDVMENK